MSEVKQNNGWISVKDRLPKNFTDVLAFNKSGFQHVVHFNRPNFLYKSNKVITPVIAEGYFEIMYWQHLPPAPKQD